MIQREVLRSKIHRARITHADLHYEGSITIPPFLMDAAELFEYEAVHVWNVTNGSRLKTYAISGEVGAADICMNGAAAHLMQPGDIVIIAAFEHVPETELASYRPRLVFVDEHNQIKEIDRPEIAGPKRQA